MTDEEVTAKGRALYVLKAARSGNSLVLHKALQDWSEECSAWLFCMLSEAALENWTYFTEAEVNLPKEKAALIITNLMSTMGTNLSIFTVLNRKPNDRR